MKEKAPNLKSGLPGNQDRIPVAALILGLAGILPFATLAFLMHLSAEPELRYLFTNSLLSYAAVIASFLGGSRWGLAMRIKAPLPQAMHLGLAVLPALIAWLLRSARADTAIVCFAILFALLGLIDTVGTKNLEAPKWYARLRTLLSIVVVVILVGVMFTF